MPAAMPAIMPARRITLRVQPPNPFGEVTVVPATLSGRPEAEMARAMAATFADAEAPSATDVFNRLRQSFPLEPLSTRVAAFSAIMGRLRHPF
ncbi:MAG: hypothetical protein ACLP19_10735 [Xanthobacteraceae bacterium]